MPMTHPRRLMLVALLSLIVGTSLFVIYRRTRSRPGVPPVSPEQLQKLLLPSLPLDDSQLMIVLYRALDRAERLMGTGSKGLPTELAQLLEAIYRDLYTGLNFDRKTGKLRNDDPFDFADFGGMMQRVLGLKQGGAGKIKLSPEFMDFDFNANSPKLEMMHPGEDFGSFLAMIYASDQQGTPTNNIILAVRKQIQRGNFEPAAKYLYFRHIDGRFKEPSTESNHGPDDITFGEVVDAIRATDGIVVQEWTVKTIEAQQRGAALIARLSAAK
jgi:hypothetical protein